MQALTLGHATLTQLLCSTACEQSVANHEELSRCGRTIREVAAAIGEACPQRAWHIAARRVQSLEAVQQA